MLSFVKHAGLALKFKFLMLEDYRYSLPVVGTILFILALMQSVALSQVFESSTNILILLSLIVTVVKYICMVIILQSMLLGKLHNSKRNLFGFILLTEGLLIPVALSFFVPVLSLLAIIWQIYILVVQFRGLIFFSGKKLINVLVAYIVAIFIAVFVSTPAFIMFDSMNLIDLEQVKEKMLENWQVNK